jgi:hypothetical protein
MRPPSALPLLLPQVRFSKLVFVDLAGSERPEKSRVRGVQLAEAQVCRRRSCRRRRRRMGGGGGGLAQPVGLGLGGASL